MPGQAQMDGQPGPERARGGELVKRKLEERSIFSIGRWAGGGRSDEMGRDGNIRTLSIQPTASIKYVMSAFDMTFLENRVWE